MKENTVIEKTKLREKRREKENLHYHY